MFEQGQYKNSVMREPFAIQVSEKFRHQAIYHSIKLRHKDKESDKSLISSKVAISKENLKLLKILI